MWGVVMLQKQLQWRVITMIHLDYFIHTSQNTLNKPKFQLETRVSHSYVSNVRLSHYNPLNGCLCINRLGSFVLSVQYIYFFAGRLSLIMSRYCEQFLLGNLLPFRAQFNGILFWGWFFNSVRTEWNFVWIWNNRIILDILQRDNFKWTTEKEWR